MAQRIVICGGGFGGIVAARRVRDLLPQSKVTLIDSATHFAMGFRKTAELIGTGTVAEGSRPLKALEAHGITVVHERITAIDPTAKTVTTDSGTTFEADALIVALGADVVPSAIPGLSEFGHNWYSFDGVAAARDAIDNFEKGRIVIGIFGAPYKCPPAPFELGLTLYSMLQVRKKRGVSLHLFSPLPASLPLLGSVACEVVEGRFAGIGGEFIRNAKATSVEQDRVITTAGDIPFDLLLAVPPHVVPPVVVDAGLAPAGGWVKVNQQTLETSFENVWALGDMVGMSMTNGMGMPKSGAFAESEAIVAAEQLVGRLQGRTSNAEFWGEGTCFLEVGDGEAMLVRGKFLADPAEFELTIPSKAFYDQKQAFEADRLAEWFDA